LDYDPKKLITHVEGEQFCKKALNESVYTGHRISYKNLLIDCPIGSDPNNKISVSVDGNKFKKLLLEKINNACKKNGREYVFDRIVNVKGWLSNSQSIVCKRMENDRKPAVLNDPTPQLDIQ
jgi:hypothetical protein